MILFIDCGDTLCDESTEVRLVPGGVVQKASLFPGAAETIEQIHALGIPICLVADGLDASFQVILRNVIGCFDGWVTSEAVGAEKPSPLMFEAAMKAMELSDSDKPQILMVGNNVRKDIAGANRFGILSVLADYSPRYDMTPHAPDEVPRFILHDICDLPALIRHLETQKN
ncbi:MAG: HAD family hydrolase [Clostridiales bacterium]|nr:HAD family hydrolase [Clostridiales bacterium]